MNKFSKARKHAGRKADSPWLEHRMRVLESYQRLSDKGLLGPDRLAISVRVPGQSAFAFLGLPEAPRKGRKTAPRTSQVAILDFDGHRVPHNDGEERFDFEAYADWIALHAMVYTHRPDVGAIVLNQPPWGGALAMLEDPMPGIFDEQARQMGPQVERLLADPARSIGGHTTGLTMTSEKLLRKGANVFLYEGHALCLGMTRERAIFNSELLEKCAKAYVLALATGQRIRRIPWFVRFIANRRLLKDERRSAESYARGEIPTGFTAY